MSVWLETKQNSSLQIFWPKWEFQGYLFTLHLHLSYFLKIKKLFMCMDVLPGCMFVCHMSVQCLQRLEGGIGSSGTRVMDCRKLLRGSWELNLGPLQSSTNSKPWNHHTCHLPKRIININKIRFYGCFRLSSPFLANIVSGLRSSVRVPLTI